MRINRPKIPTDIDGPPWGSGAAFDMYDWISGFRSSLNSSTHSADSDWHTVLNRTSESGVLRFCVFAGNNTGSGSVSLSGRVTIDATVVFNESYSISNVSGKDQWGFSCVGTIATSAQTTLPSDIIRGVAMGWLPYSDSLKIEMKTADHTNMTVRCGYIYLQTS